MSVRKTLDVFGTKINFKIDTAADITLMPYSVYQGIVFGMCRRIVLENWYWKICMFSTLQMLCVQV